jgi:hypothetical protein
MAVCLYGAFCSSLNVGVVRCVGASLLAIAGDEKSIASKLAPTGGVALVFVF